jgi:hypothetical protein
MSRTPRADRLQPEVDWLPAWERYRDVPAMRGRTNDAITALERKGSLSAPIARLLRHLLDFADERGGTRIGAVSLGEVMLRGKRRVLDLLAIACEQGWLQRIRRGGGKHRTNWFLFKVGVWRDDPHDEHAQNHFSDRLKTVYARYQAAEYQLFIEHLVHGTCKRGDCWMYAPREVKQPVLLT